MNQLSDLTIQPAGLAALPRAAAAALQWRLLLLWLVLLLIPTAVLAVPVWQTLGAMLDNSVYAAALAQRLDGVAFTDLIAAVNRNGGTLGMAGVIALVLTLLLSPLLSGMVVTAARHTAAVPHTGARAAGFGQLLTGAYTQYGRMLRMLVWAVLPLGAAAGAGWGLMHLADQYGATAILESDAQRVTYLAMAAAAVLLLLVHATLDAGRAVMAAEPRRRSAVKAWWAGLTLLVKRPLATLGVYLVISAVGLVMAAALGVARLNLPALGLGSAIGAFVVTQLAVLAVAWMRSARLFALVAITRPVSL